MADIRSRRDGTVEVPTTWVLLAAQVESAPPGLQTFRAAQELARLVLEASEATSASRTAA